MHKIVCAATAVALGMGLIASVPAAAKGGMAVAGSAGGGHHGGFGNHRGFGGHGSFGGGGVGFHGPALHSGDSGLSFQSRRGWHRSNGFDRPGGDKWRRPWGGSLWLGGGWGGYWGGYGVPYAYTIPVADYFGYFGAGGEVRVHRGMPVYDYDRGYPYDYYNGDAPLADNSAAPGDPRAFHCEIESVRDARGRPIEVRVCRGS